MVCEGDGECGASEDGYEDDGDLKCLIFYCLRGFGNGQTEKWTSVIVKSLSRLKISNIYLYNLFKIRTCI